MYTEMIHGRVLAGPSFMPLLKSFCIGRPPVMSFVRKRMLVFEQDWEATKTNNLTEKLKSRINRCVAIVDLKVVKTMMAKVPGILSNCYTR